MDISLFQGVFVTDAKKIEQKVKDIKAFVFDWDGVFNNGQKDINGSSPFSEVDAMGTNLLRLNHYLLNKEVPYTAVITGEKNEISFSFAKRESFNAVYYRVKHKINAIDHICKEQNILPKNIAFIFDDVLDFSAAAQVGLRVMVGRKATPLITEYAVKNDLADYITAYSGGEYGVREYTELIMGLSGIFAASLDHRAKSSDTYKQYLEKRNDCTTLFYNSDEIKPVSV